MYDTQTLNFFIYGFFVLAGVTLAFAVTVLVWLAATGQLLAPRPASTQAGSPAHEVVGLQPEELPETA